MNADVITLQQQLHGALLRIEQLEQQLADSGVAVEPWRYLVARPHPWRRQLSIKGRNLTVGQLLTTMRANQLSPEQASEDLDLPISAIREAIKYGENHRDLIALEASEERRRLTERGFALEPQDLSR